MTATVKWEYHENRRTSSIGFEVMDYPCLIRYTQCGFGDHGTAKPYGFSPLGHAELAVAMRGFVFS